MNEKQSNPVNIRQRWKNVLEYHKDAEGHEKALKVAMEAYWEEMKDSKTEWHFEDRVDIDTLKPDLCLFPLWVGESYGSKAQLDRFHDVYYECFRPYEHTVGLVGKEMVSIEGTRTRNILFEYPEKEFLEHVRRLK